MNNIEIIYYKENIDRKLLNNTIMIVGLPGVGHVGKFVIDYLIDFFKAKIVIELISKYFPPQVLINEDNTVSFLKHKIYFAYINNQSYLLLTGDYQSNDSKGHYELCEKYIDIALEFKVNKIITLGGYPNLTISKSCILGAVNDVSIINDFKEYGIQFKKYEPFGGIIGISGLLLPFAAQKNIPAICLMGITSGYLADPRCSKNLLFILSKILKLNINENALDSQIQDIEKVIENTKDSMIKKETSNINEEDLTYFG